MKKILLSVLFFGTSLSIGLSLSATEYDTDGDANVYYDYEVQYDESYYSSLAGLKGDAFRAELNDVISEDFVWYTYDSKNRYDILPKADAVYGQEGKVYCIYTGKIFNDDDHGTSGRDIWNTEHVWAKSHGFPSDKQLPYSDYHHLRISEGYTNTLRNNRFIGEVDGFEYSEDEWGNKYTGRTESIWEPRDSVKGDVARMLLYMDVRYDGEEDTEIDLVLLDDYDFPDEVGDPYMGNLETLLKWHYADPVDDRERSRNDVIYSYQFNRNPFVDHPEYADMIWGDGIDLDSQVADKFDDIVLNIDSNISQNSLDEIAVAYVIYNNLSEAQKLLVTSYDTYESYYNTYLSLTGYSKEQLDIIFSFYEDLSFVTDVINGNFYELESYL